MSVDCNQKKKAKKKNKPKNTTDISFADKILLEGRRECLCEASRHDLIGNCLNCGRIVCAQEGSGACFTCGQHVYSKQEKALQKKSANQAKAKNTDKKSDNKTGGHSSAGSNGLKGIADHFQKQKAEEHKNKMLEFDRNSSARTKVIDDESDYFSLSNQHWLSNDKRKEINTKVEQLHVQKHQKERKILINLETREVADYDKPVISDLEEKVAELQEESKLQTDHQSMVASEFIDNEECNLMKLKYIAPSKPVKHTSLRQQTKKTGCPWNKLKVQDSDLMMMTDEGVCLSIRQPFASLLISGIKMHEGRDWYTSFRGRLWIHAASKESTRDDIEKMKLFFRHLYPDTKFPKSYPTSSLLGCVSLVDCLPQEEYRKLHPEGICEDNFVFICQNPIPLKAAIPTNGNKKLYNLESNIHSLAQKTLQFEQL